MKRLAKSVVFAAAGRTRWLLGKAVVMTALLLLSCTDPGVESYWVSLGSFEVREATITSVHNALRAGDLTCRELVETYLDRIETYDEPAGLNSIVRTNPDALARAAELDEEFEKSRTLRSLHCVPLIVKDNYDTVDMPTTAGSLALQGSIPPDDAYQVEVLRERGAIVLAKSNMAEWAFSPYETVSSIGGTTRNPYDTSRVPAGSSGGTAAAVAANFGLAGLGTDTGNSIRGPSSHTALVGIRSTIGLTSRDGIIPLNLSRDVGGPMMRTVEDAAKILQAIAGPDPADPVTAASRGKVPPDYVQFLDLNGLRGARLGVLRALVDTSDADAEIKRLFEQALVDLQRQGAEIIDPFAIPNFDELRKDLWCKRLRYDLNRYLDSLGPQAPVRSLAEIVESGKYHPSVEEDLREELEIKVPPAGQDPPCLGVEEDPRRAVYRQAVLEAMAEHDIDALLYPSWTNPPRLVGDTSSPHGNNSPVIAPHTGQPAITIPMGFTMAGLPAGLQILGKPFGEPDLIRFAYAYEQATHHRKPPPHFR